MLPGDTSKLMLRLLPFTYGEFCTAVQDAPGPTRVDCRTFNRSVSLSQLSSRPLAAFANVRTGRSLLPWGRLICAAARLVRPSPTLTIASLPVGNGSGSDAIVSVGD